MIRGIGHLFRKKDRKNSPMDKPTTDAAAPAPAAPEAAPAAATTPAVDPKLAELQAQVADLQDKNLRLRAEMENYRKRAQRDLADLRPTVTGQVVEQWLPVLDHFQLALAAIDSAPDTAAVKKGMGLIANEFTRALQNLGIELIPTVGQEFDPRWHHAITTEPSTTAPAQQIVREWQAGYKLGTRLLRAAGVVVSSGPPAPAAPPAPETTATTAPAAT